MEFVDAIARRSSSARLTRPSRTFMLAQKRVEQTADRVVV